MEDEVGRLVVRLMGDPTAYEKMLSDAETAVKDAVAAVEKSAIQLEAAGISVVAGAAETATEAAEGLEDSTNAAGGTAENTAHAMENLGISMNNMGTVASGGVDLINSLGGSFDRLKTLLAEVTIAYALLRGEIALMSAFVEQERNAIRFNAVLVANNRNVAELTTRYSAFAKRMSEVSTVSRDAVSRLLQQAEVQQFTGETAERVVRNAIALAAATDSDAESFIRATGAMERGNLQLLRRRLGLQGITTEAELMIAIQKQINAGLATETALVSSTGHQLELLSRSFKVFSKEMGVAVATVLMPFIWTLKQMASLLASLPGSIKGVVYILVAFSGVIGIIGALLPILANIKIAFLAVKAAALSAQAGFLTASTAGTIMAVAAAAALIYLAWQITGAAAAYDNLAVAIARSRSANERLIAQRASQFAERTAGLEGMQPIERQQELNILIQETSRRADEAARANESNNRAVAASEPTWLSAFQAGKAYWEANKEGAAQTQAALEQVRGQLETLRVQQRAVAREIEEGPLKILNDMLMAARRSGQTAGMSPDQITLYDAKESGMEQWQIDSVAYGLSLAATARWQAAATARVSDFNADLQEQIDTFGMAPRDIELYRMALDGIPESAMAGSRAISAELDAVEANKEAMDRARQVTEEFMDPLMRMMTRTAELQDLFDREFITKTTFDAALQSAEDSFYGVADAAKTARNEVQKFDGALSGSVEAISRIEAFRELMRVPLNIAATQTASQTIVAANRPADRQLDSDATWRAGVLTQLTQSNTYLSRIVNRPAPQPAGI